ncbi:MAG: glucose 1-dehydrogenase [Desulfobacterales bacterium]|nr:glucose 1-dehydrogenase [Desulfobacterales bacterium]
MQTKRTNFRVDGKVALVTGAGRGLGAEAAEVLAEAGAKVVVTDITQDQPKAVVERIKKGGGQALFLALDVAKADQWASVVDKTVSTYGGLDILVNNAGVESMNLIENTTTEEYQFVQSVNNLGVFLGTKYAILAMKPGGASGRGGSIVNICSITANVGFQGACAYSAAKGSVRAFTKVAAVECGKLQYGIRVNSIHPGVILTELTLEGMQKSAERGVFKSVAEAQALYESMHPIGRLGQPVDVAQAVLYLASDASAFVTGAELVVDGGYIVQ